MRNLGEIPCGGANLSKDADPIEGVYATTHLKIRSLMSVKHKRDAEYKSKQTLSNIDAF